MAFAFVLVRRVLASDWVRMELASAQVHTAPEFGRVRKVLEFEQVDTAFVLHKTPKQNKNCDVKR